MSEQSFECTNWDAYDVPRIWQMVSGEDDQRGWAQVSAWFRLRDAMDAQRERLDACSQSLAQKWPRAHSEAAGMFVDYLDGLIASMDETSSAAASTAGGLAGIMQTLAAAKSRVEPIHRQWQEVTTDWTPQLMVDDEERLNREARVVMLETDRAILDYSGMIKVPARYETDGHIEPSTPLTPPTQQRDARISEGADGSPTGILAADSSRSSLPAIPHDPPPPKALTPASSQPPLSPSFGPSLAGNSVPHPPHGGTSPQLGGSIPAPFGPGGPSVPLQSPIYVQRPGTIGRRGIEAPFGARPGANQPRETGAYAEAARSQQRSGGAQATEHLGAGGMAPGGGLIGSADGRKRPAAKTEEQWGVPRGVAPVIGPSMQEPDHDPGPGVIGIDR